MFQKLWLAGIKWDDPLPHELCKNWLSLRQDLMSLEKVKIGRWLQTEPNSTLEIHGFSDASEVAYSAVVYARTINRSGQIKVNLISSKTKVAPTKQISLPRLELCGALLLAKLMAKISKCMDDEVRLYSWCDSTIVLAWLKAQPNRWKTFVANRVSSVQTLIPQSKWHHISFGDNPADCASRGILPSQLKDHALWWNGPYWLKQESLHWPNYKNEICTSLEEKTIHSVQLCHNIISNNEFLERYSSITRLKRITAYCFRFITNLKIPSNVRKCQPLIAVDLENALTYWISYVQVLEFKEEISCCRSGNNLSSKSKLLGLSPFLDNKGLLRVGGRLAHSNNNFNSLHQIILPQKNKLTNLLISESHLSNLHAGPMLMLNSFRRTYWILGARSVVRQHVHKCVTCFKQKAKTSGTSASQPHYTFKTIFAKRS